MWCTAVLVQCIHGVVLCVHGVVQFCGAQGLVISGYISIVLLIIFLFYVLTLFILTLLIITSFNVLIITNYVFVVK